MPTLTATLMLNYGPSTPSGAVQQRLPLTYTLDYTEAADKVVHVAPSQTNFPISLDSVAAPKFLFIRAVDIDVQVTLGDGTDTVPTALAVAQGWVMLSNPNGQDINTVLVTTPATPTTGARVQVIAFE